MAHNDTGNTAQRTVGDLFWSSVRAASTTSSPSERDLAYTAATALAGPAIQEYVRTQAPEVRKVLFNVNYTDEGSVLVTDRMLDADDAAVDMSIADVEAIDEMIFVVSGTSEDGSGIPGMQVDGVDRFVMGIPAIESAPPAPEADPEDKYILTNERHPEFPELRRIRANRDIDRHGVKAGDLGGYIASERSLANNGDCWVDDTSCVRIEARVLGDALVAESSNVTGTALLAGSGKVLGVIIT